MASRMRWVTIHKTAGELEPGDTLVIRQDGRVPKRLEVYDVAIQRQGWPQGKAHVSVTTDKKAEKSMFYREHEPVEVERLRS